MVDEADFSNVLTNFCVAGILVSKRHCWDFGVVSALQKLKVASFLMLKTFQLPSSGMASSHLLLFRTLARQTALHEK